MKHILITLALMFTCNVFALSDAITDIKNFRQFSDTIASAGMPDFKEFKLIEKHGYQHVINLIPGDFDDEQQLITSLGMTFEQIPVVWSAPKLADFERLVSLMQNYQVNGDNEQKSAKVLIHCRLNYRASAFAYLYQVTQQGVNPDIAKKQMLTVWQPDDIWQTYIETVMKHYQEKTK